MTRSLEAADVLRFRSLVTQWMGLQFDDDRLDQLATMLRDRVDACGGRTDVYLEKLSSGPSDEIGVLAKSLTVGETYFFRYLDHFRAFAEAALPDPSAAPSP
jgi:chemotaxis protein methyltransferase CheR